MIDQTLLNRYERDLTLRGFSPKTRDTYYRNLVKFFNHKSISPDKITGEEIKDYLYYLIKDKKLSDSSLRQARSSIIFFFHKPLIGLSK